MHLTAFLDFVLRALQGGGNFIPGAWSVFSGFSAAIALTAIWQGVAVALGLALCLRLAPRSPARHRFALWATGFGVLVSLQVLPLLSRLIPLFPGATSGSVSPVGAAMTSHPLLQLSATWSFVIAALWLAASLVRAIDLSLHSLHLRKLWKTAVPVKIDPSSLPRSMSRISPPAVEICTTSELERPSVIGFFAPRILIPDWLFLRLTPGELDQIVLHETEHLRRRDDWTNLLQKLCLVLFPLNPGLSWIERRLCREREMACDDGVIRITRAPRAYAACLASLAERGLERRAGLLSLGAWQARPELVRRVHSILRHKHGLSPLAARAVLGTLGCILLIGAMELARCPRLFMFEPAHNRTTTQIPSDTALNSARGISYPQPLTALDKPNPVSNTSDFSAQNPTSQDFATLKPRDFRRAEHSVGLSGASAPEAVTSSSITRDVSQHRAERTLAIASSRRHAAYPLDEIAADDSGLRARRSNAVPEFGPDSTLIVMSTWERFEVTPPEMCPKRTESNPAGCNESIRIAGPTAAVAAQRITPRITVTRMYLKIFSAGDKGSTWLVIQL